MQVGIEIQPNQLFAKIFLLESQVLSFCWKELEEHERTRVPIFHFPVSETPNTHKLETPSKASKNTMFFFTLDYLLLLGALALFRSASSSISFLSSSLNRLGISTCTFTS